MNMIKYTKQVKRDDLPNVNLNNWDYLGQNKNGVKFYAMLLNNKIHEDMVQILAVQDNKIQFYPTYDVKTILNLDYKDGLSLESYIPDWNMESKQLFKLQDDLNRFKQF